MRTKETVGKRRRRTSRWLWVLGSVLILLLLIAALVPVILSSGGFTRWLQGQISRSTGGQAGIGDLSVGWLRGVRVAKFHFRGPDGWAQVDIGGITTRPRLGSLLTGTLALNRTVIDQPRVQIDLRQRPASTGDPSVSIEMSRFQHLNDVVVRDASVHLTDTNGQTMEITDLDSELSVRPPGHKSDIKMSMVVAQANGPGRVQVAGQVTPRPEKGWSLKGTNGDLTVEVNDLNVDSVAPLLALAGVQIQAKGRVSADMKSQIKDGRLANLNATVRGQGLDVSGQALGGDRLQTSQLEVQADLTLAGQMLNVDQLNVRTDWATVSATGQVPKTAQSLQDLLKKGDACDLKGQFDVDLAALLSQIPNLAGVREGLEITGGRAGGTVNTTTQAGQAKIVAEAQIAGLAGVVDGQELALSEPVLTTLRLTADETKTQVEKLSVTAPFATINASGDLEQIDYEGQVNLAALRSELGPFVDLGPYEVSGNVQSKGRISVADETVGMVGSLSARQLVLAAPDGNSLAEPTADVDFSMTMNRPQQSLDISRLTTTTSFGQLAVREATVPLGAESKTPLNLAVSASEVELDRLKPYLAFFASLPQDVTIGGSAQAQVTVTREKGTYRIFSDATTIEDFLLNAPEQEAFRQDQVAAQFNVYVDPNEKSINIEQLQVESPQIKIRKGQFRRTGRGDRSEVQGTLEAQWDWAAVGKVASAFVPGELDIAGQRQVAVNFASTYPTDEPNGLLANLDSKASLSFDRADYMGLNFGPTDIDIEVEKGMMQIKPFATTVNNGQFRFAGEADLSRRPILLRTPGPLQVAENIQITQEMAGTFLKFVNPIFANAVNVSGVLSFASETMAIPLTGGAADKAEVFGTLAIPNFRLQATLLNQILGIIKKSLRDEVLVMPPTKIALENGAVRYDDMQINAGDNPINFGGTVGLNGAVDMTVVLPYTYSGKTARIGEPTGQRGERIALPLTGVVTKLNLDLDKVLEMVLREQMRRGFQRLFN